MTDFRKAGAETQLTELPRSPTSPDLFTRSSSKSFGRSMSKSQTRIPPLAVKLNFKVPELDEFGFPQVRGGPASHSRDWNGRHHLHEDRNGTGVVSNDEVAFKQRRYFSKATQSDRELKDELSQVANGQSIIRKMDSTDWPSLPRQQYPVSPDAGAPVLIEKHKIGGSMRDRDGLIREWDDRWHHCMSPMNEQMHPSHRGTFVRKSFFESSTSQFWRRHEYHQEAPGKWKKHDIKKPPTFGPMGD